MKLTKREYHGLSRFLGTDYTNHKVQQIFILQMILDSVTFFGYTVVDVVCTVGCATEKQDGNTILNNLLTHNSLLTCGALSFVAN